VLKALATVSYFKKMNPKATGAGKEKKNSHSGTPFSTRRKKSEYTHEIAISLHYEKKSADN